MLPAGHPARAAPGLLTRSSFQDRHTALVILAVQHGNPVTVQTLAPTTPLMLLTSTYLVQRRALPTRLIPGGACEPAGGRRTTLVLDRNERERVGWRPDWNR